MQISKNTQIIQVSPIRKMFDKAMDYDRVINFSLGEPDFAPSENVLRAACQAIMKGHNKYTANAGIIELRQAISQTMAATKGVYDPKREIAVTPGAMNALFLTFKTVLNPGDEVILFAPCWTNYMEQIKMCGAVSVLVPVKEDKGFMPDIGDLERVMTARTRILLINTPANPTGARLDEDTLKVIANLAMEKDLLVISDEVYEKIIYDGIQHVSIATLEGMRNRTIIINSLSKSYALTGWRIGYAAGSENFISRISMLQEYVNACAPTPCQYGALEALTGPQDYVDHMVAQYQRRRDIIVSRLNTIPGITCRKPQGTFYAFANIKGTGMTSEAFALKLLEEKQVVVAPGHAFTPVGEGYIRISFASSEDQIKEGLERIGDFVAEHCKVQ